MKLCCEEPCQQNLELSLKKVPLSEGQRLAQVLGVMHWLKTERFCDMHKKEE